MGENGRGKKEEEIIKRGCREMEETWISLLFGFG